MEEDEDWVRIFKTFYRGFSQCRRRRFHLDVSCVALGIKSAHLVDYLHQDPMRLQAFLQGQATIPLTSSSRDQTPQAQQQQQTAHHHQPKDLFILTINDDILIVNRTSLRNLSERPPPIFVDVTRGRSPSIMSPPDVARIEKTTLNCLDKFLQLPDSDKPVPIISHSQRYEEEGVEEEEGKVCGGTLDWDVNVCSLFGLLLGYPVVYWFDVKFGYDLEMESLVQHMVQARWKGGGEGVKRGGKDRGEGVKGDEGTTEVLKGETGRGGGEKVEGIEYYNPRTPQNVIPPQELHLLFSFTIPECVFCKEVQDAIGTWYNALEARATEKGVHVEMRVDTMTCPSIVL